MTSTRWLDNSEQHTWRAYLDATRLLVRALDGQLTRDSGISFADYELLVVLSEAPGGRLRMSELADAVTTTRSGVTRATTRLVDAGWVHRVKCDDDKRGMSAELTDAGMAKLADASPGHVAAVRELMFDRLTTEDVASLGQTFDRMRSHITG
ncbi:MarR family transcriptional regulator [Rhodococcus sp. 06-156-3C]|uniref:MarR family winged helix-turn-helix transcriptional regulator n=1 Tax=Nocardiaceae TaxID=85025 RepID=UPI000522F8C9|nr:MULTISPECIES: MarR family transcriptional regulator [Rhodococcus]OZC56767.1 MarR family transcriptional regulator [Rhodococcus sp. 06-621-2]OZD06757.1 MarR family transcriptional regulator [Rhodococcus sp. 06-156-4C]OZD20504.1 MarR family transcriptional regulator [Rhodococcus sp. 06-156-3C]OZD27613.1 MarR family transcriptional regulator [Rhodococcus sp. 06-156-4a]OZD35728.1 MarR family transcriptional regulator [Rhodococcus sp. 06-156-3b]